MSNREYPQREMYAMPSTGDAARDAEEIDAFAQTREALDRGRLRKRVRPNGLG